MADTPIPILHEAEPEMPTAPYVDGSLGGAASSLACAMLGPFEVGEVLGRGGMGIVFDGLHLVEDVRVAIKVITRRGAEHQTVRDALRAEVQAAAVLDHPAIVRLLDYGEIGRDAADQTSGELRAGSPYFVMEQLPHGTLANVVGRVTWLQVKAILLTLLDALAHAHALDVVHRDIKPGNILLGEFGGRVIPKLADFGLAFATETSSHHSRSVGTPQYMAPEQIQQSWRTHGPWSDLYSVGCVAYELLTGRRLFNGKTIAEIVRKHLEGKRRPIRSMIRYPDEFRAWLTRMLAVAPSERFQSAADAARALLSIDDSDISDVRPPDHTSLAVGGLTPVLDVFRRGKEADRAGFARVWSAVGPRGEALRSAIPETWETPRYERMSMRLVGAGLGLFGLRVPPLVGRVDELEVIWQAMRRVAGDGTREALLIRGVEGVGKTRLGDWFVRRAKELGAAEVLRATHTPDGGAADGLPRMLARHFRTLGATRTEATIAVRETMSSRGFEDAYDWRAMGALVTEGMDFEEGDEGHAFEFSGPRQRYSLILRYLAGIAAERPLVLWLDDSQWGYDTLSFVEWMLESDEAPNVPILVILSTSDEALERRSDEAEATVRLTARPDVRELTLEPLNDAEHEALIREVAYLENDLTLTLCERTAGNPRLAVELIGDWVARRVLEVGEDGFVLRPGARADIPDSLHEVWEGRIRELVADHGPDARLALELAAALGHEVDYAEWDGVCRIARVTMDPSLTTSLFQRRLARPTETGWAFSHAVLRASLVRSARDAGRWREHMKRCAYLIELRHDVHRAPFSERYGRYLVGAEEFGRALSPLMQGADDRRRHGEYRRAHTAIGEVTHALEALSAPALDERWGRLWTLRACTHLNDSEPKQAKKWADRAIAAAEEFGWAEVLIEASAWHALSLVWIGESGAAEAVERAFDMLLRAEVEVGHDVHGALALALTRMRRFDAAKFVLDRAEALPSDERQEANNRVNRARIAIYEGEWADALRHAQHALELFEAIGHHQAMSNCLEYIAEVYRVTGETDRAAEIYRRCIKIQKSVGYPTLISEINLGSILLKETSFAEAEEVFLKAVEGARAISRRRLEVVSHAGLMASVAGLGREWPSFIELCWKMASFMDGSIENEREIGTYMELAGDLAAEAGRDYEAEVVYELTIRHYLHLDAEDMARKVQQKVDRLDLFG